MTTTPTLLLRTVAVPLLLLAGIIGAADGVRGAATSLDCERHHSAAAVAPHDDDMPHGAPMDAGRGHAPDDACKHCPDAACAIVAPCSATPSLLALAAVGLDAASVPAAAPIYPPGAALVSRPRAPPVPPPDIRSV